MFAVRNIHRPLFICEVSSHCTEGGGMRAGLLLLFFWVLLTGAFAQFDLREMSLAAAMCAFITIILLIHLTETRQ